MHDEAISQKVREYHKRFVEIIEKRIADNKIRESSISYREILSLASHSNAVNDVIPGKAVHYNRLAAERTYTKGLVLVANKYYKNATDIINKEELKIDPLKRIDLYISYAKCLLDEQTSESTVTDCITKTRDIIRNEKNEMDTSLQEIELGLVEALNNYRSRNFDEALKLSESVIQNEKSGSTQKVRAKFYFAASLPPSEAEQRKTAHIEVIEDSDKILENGEISEPDRIEVLKVKSEAANNTGFVFLFGIKKPAEAIKYFEEAIKINELPEINDQKGIAISHGGLGDCFKQLKQIEKAESEYKINLDISRRNGDKQGICRMTSMIGAINIEKGIQAKGEAQKEFFKKSGKLYDESLATAEEQKNVVNILFSLSGMLETVVASREKDRTDYALNVLENTIKEYDISKTPEFAKNAVITSLNKLKETNSGYDGLVIKFVENLN